MLLVINKIDLLFDRIKPPLRPQSGISAELISINKIYNKRYMADYEQYKPIILC